MLCKWFKKKNKGDWKNPDFNYIWDHLKLDIQRLDQVKHYCEIILANRIKYQEIENIIGCPWWFIAGIHYRESCLDFKGCLHNGQRIIGTNKKTTWVPIGRGPFPTWESSAIDVLKMQKLHKVDCWDLHLAIAYAEKFNGLGYRYKGTGEYSPYLFAGTNFHDETGKYVADGKYDDNAIEKQLGVCAIWLGLKSAGINI